jgi:hypothetical protein
MAIHMKSTQQQGQQRLRPRDQGHPRAMPVLQAAAQVRHPAGNSGKQELLNLALTRMLRLMPSGSPSAANSLSCLCLDIRTI